MGSHTIRLSADLAVRGQEIDASNVLLMTHGARIAGEGGYDVRTERLHGHIEGDGLVLSKFRTFAKASPNADGTLTFVADANGTMEQPGLKATATLAGVKLDGKPLGEIAAQAHSEGSELFYAAQSTLVGAKLDGTGETRLTGDYETQDAARVLGVRRGDGAGGLRAGEDEGAVVDWRGGDGERAAEEAHGTERRGGAARFRREAARRGAEGRGAVAREFEGWGGDAGAGTHRRRRHKHAGERDSAGVRRDRSRGREAGCEGQRKREPCDCAYVRPGDSVEREGGVHGGGGRTDGEAVADGPSEVRPGERGDGGDSEWAEFAERDAGVQRGPAGGGEPDRDDGRGPVEDWRLPDLSQRRLCRPDGDGRCGARADEWG